MKVVFMGTPDYAVPTLEAIINEGYEVAAVFCQPDKPVGRKHILTPPAVKVCAEKYNIPVYQPNSVRTDEAYDLLCTINPDVIVVVAYGKILPERILDLPRLGCINGHGSILPKYRGAAPIQWAVINGEKVTGVTAMYMDKGIDTGDILDIRTTEIGEFETADSLFERLSVITADLLIDTLKKAESGTLSPVKQNEQEASYASIINKEMALIDFSEPADIIFNKVRGFNSWPVAYTFLDGKRFKVYECRIGSKTDLPVGSIIEDNTLKVACGDNTSLIFTDIQLEGSKRMSADEFLKGKKLAKGTIFGDGENRG